MKMKVILVIFVLLAFHLSVASSDDGHHHEITAEQVGNVSFETSCAESVQKKFQIATAWLYSFEYELAASQFESIAQNDPQCAMAYWGQAMSLYHQLWSRPSKEDITRGARLLEKARSLRAKTERERDYIEALSLFYAADDPENYTKRVEAYSNAMETIMHNNPKDREAAVFYALSLLARADGKDPELKLEKKAVEILNSKLHQAPAHPGITHYVIHATDNPQLASMGLEAARVYAKIAPASPHAVHMPSHIFARLGMWEDDIRSNLAAIAVADKMKGDHSVHHRLHSMDFLLSAYLQIGDDQKARAQMDALQKLPKSSMMRDYREYYDQAKYSFPATYALERKQWKEALSIHPDPADAPHTQVIAYWARAIAAGYLRDADSASGAVDQMLAAVEATKKSDKAYLVDFLDAAIKEAQAWSLHAKGQDEEALNLLRTAADLQDRVGKSETEIPAREMLADLLLEIGRSNEALTEFEASLQANPNRFNALYGAARAAELSNHSDKANQYYTQLLKNCSRDSERPELAQARKLAKQ